MYPISAVSELSLARIVGFYYALAGLFSVLVYVVTNTKEFTASLGFLIPFLSAELTFRYHQAYGFAGIVWQIISFTFLYGLSGWLSGFLVGIAYNFVSKHFGYQVEGVMDSQPLSAPTH
jgi:hypothetical protein